MKNVLRLLVVVGVLTLVGLPLTSQAETLIEIESIRPGDLETVGFELTKGGDVNIEAVGLRQRYDDGLLVYSWIIDSKTREPVWIMRERNSERHGRRGAALRIVEKAERLEAGSYELYMFASEGQYGSITIKGGKDFVGFLGDLFDDDDWDEDSDYIDLIRDCYVKISSDDLSAADMQTFEVTGEIPNALVSFTRLGDDEYIRQPFKLDREMSIRIYALIEHPRGYRDGVDYGWIVNAETRDKVWEMDRWSTERGGGGKKNRKFDDEVRLEAGTYVLHFVTDDSHSYDEFNVAPPYDPYNWGITLLPGDGFVASAFHLTEPAEEEQPLIDLTRARDNDYAEQAFRLKAETELRVYAIGECPSRDFVDYGWIQRVGTSEIVWEMTYRNTDHAGGGSKNRMFDGFITLPAGEYIAAYVTDGSHSYRDWNSGQPFDPQAWGLAIYPVSDRDKNNIELIDLDDIQERGSVLASITRVGDRKRARRSFTLDERAEVHIYAIGEGSDGRMYDYAYIEDESTGRTVWEMTYRKTDHAGGAKKNRMYDDVIVLDAGSYEVFFESDGSHSFRDWNSSPPRDQRHWGVTVSLAEGNRAGR